MGLFSGQIEAFPSNNTIFISMTPVEEGDDYYEIELNRDENLLALFLKKAQALMSPTSAIINYRDFAQKVLHQNVGTIYIDQGRINNVVDVFHRNAPDPSKIPNPQSNMYVTESFVLNEDSYINDAIVPKGKRITLYHKGNLQ
jgi:hypothetical protein